MVKLDSVPAAIYARISRDREGAGLGVDRQEIDCRALAKRLGWEVVAVYVDNDISAYSGAPRPQYRAMLEAVRSGEVTGIIAWHTDRLHRRATELEEFVTIAEAHQLQIQTVSAGTVDLSSASGRMVARMLGAAAQHEIDHARERIKRAKEQAALDGKYRGGPRPYGFEKDGLTIREGEAMIIREMTKSALAGRTLAALTRDLNQRIRSGDDAARPATMKDRDGSMRGSGQWRYGAIRDMLIRPRNAGLLARGLPGKTGQKYDFEEVGPAAWQPIVSEEEWRALVALLTDPNRRMNPMGSDTRWLGSGIYRCAVPIVGEDGAEILCGGRLRATPHGGTATRTHARRYLYRCVESAHLTIGQRQTDEYVLGVVADMVRDPRVIAAMNPGNTDLGDARETRNLLVMRLASFESDYALGKITGAQLQKATAAVAAELAEVDAKLTRALRRSNSSSVMRAADPGAAFLSAPIDIQRAVLATVINVEILPATKRGSAWLSDRVRITTAA